MAFLPSTLPCRPLVYVDWYWCGADDIAEHNFSQLVTDYFGRLNLNAGVQKLLAVSNPYSDIYDWII